MVLNVVGEMVREFELHLYSEELHQFQTRLYVTVIYIVYKTRMLLPLQ